MIFISRVKSNRTVQVGGIAVGVLSMVLLLLLLPICLLAQPKCTETWTKGGLSLSGHLGATEVQAYLHMGHPSRTEDGVSGVLIRSKTWRPGQGDDTFSLYGTVSAKDCSLRLTGGDQPPFEPLGEFQLRFASGRRLIGKRSSPTGLTEAVSLKLVPPVSCRDGRGPWRTFRSPLWPVTFDYPGSWRIFEDREERQVMVQCPDAEDLANGAVPVFLKWGVEVPESTTVDSPRPSWRIGRFVTFRRDRHEWMVGSCEEDVSSVFCGPAVRSEVPGMTVWQGAAGENRLYRPGGGGYIGQGGPRKAYLFLLLHSGQWVTLDGNGVTERLVRSVKPR